MGDDIVYKEFESAGVWHQREACAFGLSHEQIRHRVRIGAWIEVFPRVYRHAATPSTPDVLRQAALFWAGTDATLSHRSAGAVWTLDDMRDDEPELLVPQNRNPRTAGVIVHRAHLAAADVTTPDGLRCTTLPRTIFDLASVLDDISLETAIESARRIHGMELGAVRKQLEMYGSRGRGGTARVKAMLERLDGDRASESALEVKVAGRLRASRLPPFVRQHWIAAFGRRYRVDFAWPDQRVALECDGRAFHEFQRDRTRLRQLSASGWTVLPVTWNDVTKRWFEVVAELTSAIRRVR